ncbi:MAG: hypothetical protein M1832_005274 [Thelocarpon impressellum]|nr:MAG: hypothetical protein M1832_005274 [Thelocarpon impressellum]
MTASTTSSSSHPLDPQEEGWEDVQPENDEPEVQCLLSDGAFPDMPALLQHCKEAHGLDVAAIRKELGLDFYGTIRLVNYIRAEVLAGRGLPELNSSEAFADQRYLQPVLEDDALLFNIDEIPGGEDNALSQSRVTELEEELQRLRSDFTEYRETVQRTLDQRLEEPAPEEKEKEKPDDDSHYFTSYSYNDIHEVMLKDTVRTDAYRDFIYEHKQLFHGKTVLDVGCGTGILSMFCAKAGAARVLAVDNSDIIDKARENVFENGLGNVITCLRGKIEEVTLPVPRVDVIVSEWMGYCLLYEAMLDSVLWARDHYLAPDGLLVPSHMTLYLAPLADPDYVASHVSFWHDVYGFSMRAMQAHIHDDVLTSHVAPSALASAPFPVLHLPLHTTTPNDLKFTNPFSVSLDKSIDALDGFVLYFDTFFLPSRSSTLPHDSRAETYKGPGVAFTTGPFGKETHWRQGVLLVDHGDKPRTPLREGDVLRGEVTYRKHEDNARELDVEVRWSTTVAANTGVAKEEGRQVWFMR